MAVLTNGLASSDGSAVSHLVGGGAEPGRWIDDHAAPVTPGACRRIIRDYTSERGILQLTRCLQTNCRKVTLELETVDAGLVCERVTAGQGRASARRAAHRPPGRSRPSPRTADALGRACAWVSCDGLVGSAALRRDGASRSGRSAEDLRRVGVCNPLFVLDGIDRLDDGAPWRRSWNTG